MNSKYEKKNPLRLEIERSIGKFNLEITVQEDKDTLEKFKNLPGPIIAYLCTIRKNSEIIGIGRGSAILTRINKYYDRSIRYAFNASLIDGMVHSVKALDALYLKTDIGKEIKTLDEVDLEGRDSPAFYGEDDLPQTATIKQINFLKKLVEHCEDSEKEEFLSALASPYLSKFQCSELIQRLMPVK